MQLPLTVAKRLDTSTGLLSTEKVEASVGQLDSLTVEKEGPGQVCGNLQCQTDSGSYS